MKDVRDGKPSCPQLKFLDHVWLGQEDCASFVVFSCLCLSASVSPCLCLCVPNPTHITHPPYRLPLGLYLRVYVPERDPDDFLPVFFWIYGGGWVFGDDEGT